MQAADDGVQPRLALVNGTIVTMDPEQPAAAAVAVIGGRVAFVGDSREVERVAGPTARVVDLAGRTVIPGLVDAHVHLATDAASRDQVDVRDLFGEVRSIATIADRLRSAAAGCPPGAWIAARGSPMQALRLDEGRLPTRAELDAAVPEQPAYVTFGAHVLVANSAAIAARGIDRSTADPDRGVIERDPAGEPTGVFHERAGVLVKGPAGAVDPTLLEEAIELELDSCLSRGVTTVHDVVADPSELDAYRRLRQADRLRARVAILVRVVQSGFDGRGPETWHLPDPAVDGLLWRAGVKMSVDGGFTGGNAAFSEPIGQGRGRGLIRITGSELDALVDHYDAAGVRIAIHAMGDVAIELALGAYEARAGGRGFAMRRHRVEHLGDWLLTPDRLDRARRLGVTPVPNPSMHHHLGPEIAADLGPRRADGAFDYAAIERAGLPLVTGSDGPGYWPVDVLRDIATMTTRQTRDGGSIGTGLPIPVTAALRAQTVTAAWLGFREADLGSLRVGMRADLAVLPTSLAVAVADPATTGPVDLTMVDGRVVYERQP